MEFDYQTTPSVDKWRTFSLDDLPFEILIHIFGFLNETQLCHLSNTCKYWYTTSSQSSLWRPCYQLKWKVLNIKPGLFVTEEEPSSPNSKKNISKIKKPRRARAKSGRRKDNDDEAQFNSTPKRKNSLNTTSPIKIGFEWKTMYMERFLLEKDDKTIFNTSTSHPLESLEHWKEAFNTLLDACSTIQQPSSPGDLTPLEEIKLLEGCTYITRHKFSSSAGSVSTRFILFSHTLPSFVEFRFIRSTNMGLYECLSYKTFDGQTGSVLRSEAGISEQLEQVKVEYVKSVLAIQSLDWLSFFRFLLIASVPQDIELQDQLYDSYLAGLD